MSARRSFRVAALALLPLFAAACSSPAPSFADRRPEQHNRMGVDSLRRGDLASAAVHFEQALDLGRALDDRRQQVNALNNLGIVQESLGNLAPALLRYDQALALAPLAEFPQGVFAAELNRSRVLLSNGDVKAATAALGHAEEVGDTIGSRIARAQCLAQRAAITEESGDDARAIELAREAARLFEVSGDEFASRLGEADARLRAGRLLSKQGDRIKAIDELGAAHRLAQDVADRGLIAASLSAMGEALERSGFLDDARVRYQLAFDVNRRIPNVRRALENVEALERIAKAQGKADQAEEARRLRAEIAPEKQTGEPPR